MLPPCICHCKILWIPPPLLCCWGCKLKWEMEGRKRSKKVKNANRSKSVFCNFLSKVLLNFVILVHNLPLYSTFSPNADIRNAADMSRLQSASTGETVSDVKVCEIKSVVNFFQALPWPSRRTATASGATLRTGLQQLSRCQAGQFFLIFLNKPWENSHLSRESRFEVEEVQSWKKSSQTFSRDKILSKKRRF